MEPRQENGYSARVKIRLHINGRALPVAKVGPDSLLLHNPEAIPASTIGEIVLQIDKSIQKRSVCLFEGATVGQARVRFF